MASHNERLLELAMQRAVHGKGDLATSLAENCLAPGVALSERELALAFDIVRILLGTVDVGIRRHLAAYLADRSDLPDDLIATLVHDDIAVAYPLLVRNQMLSDELLIDVTAKRGTLHRMAIARRHALGAAVSSALIATEDQDVIECLLYNSTAKIDAESFDAVVRDYAEVSALHIPLVHRRELSVAQARHLADRVSRSLRRRLSVLMDAEPALV